MSPGGLTRSFSIVPILRLIKTHHIQSLYTRRVRKTRLSQYRFIANRSIRHLVFVYRRRTTRDSIPGRCALKRTRRFRRIWNPIRLWTTSRETYTRTIHAAVDGYCIFDNRANVFPRAVYLAAVYRELAYEPNFSNTDVRTTRNVHNGVLWPCVCP